MRLLILMALMFVRRVCMISRCRCDKALTLRAGWCFSADTDTISSFCFTTPAPADLPSTALQLHAVGVTRRWRRGKYTSKKIENADYESARPAMTWTSPAETARGEHLYERCSCSCCITTQSNSTKLSRRLRMSGLQSDTIRSYLYPFDHCADKWTHLVQ